MHPFTYTDQHTYLDIQKLMNRSCCFYDPYITTHIWNHTSAYDHPLAPVESAATNRAPTSRYASTYTVRLILYVFLYRFEVFDYIDVRSTTHTAPKRMATTQTTTYPTMIILISNAILCKMHCYTIVLS